MKKYLKTGLLSLFSLMLLTPAYAVDPASEIGAEQARFEREWEQERDARPPKKVPLTSGELIEDETADQRAIPAGSTFRLNSVQFTGNESIPAQDLQAEVQPYLGREVGLADLREIASEVKDLYRTRGYVAAYVYVPPQNIAGGNVEIAVIEGRVGNVEVEGNKWFSESVIRRALGVKLGKVLFYNTLRKGLAYINKKKDIKATSVLKPGTEEGTTDVKVNVEDDLPIHLSTDVNNLGTDNTGRTRWGVAASHDNLLGQMDRLSARYQVGKGTHAVGTNYLFPIHETGTSIGLHYSYSKVDVGGDFKALGIEGEAYTYGIDVNQELFSNEWSDFVFTSGFEVKEIENTIGDVVSGRDRLRTVKAGLNTEFTDRWGKTFAPQNFYLGVGGSHGTDLHSRLGADADFFYYRGSLIRYNRLPWGMMLSLRSSWQISSDRLPPSEQFRLGGAFTVRGYEEGEYLADNGFFGATELYIPSYFFPEDWTLPWSEKPLRQQIQGTGFIDFGYGNLKNSVVGEKDDRTLVGLGFGVRIHLYDRLFARLQWATPIGSDAKSGSETGFYYGVSAEIL